MILLSKDRKSVPVGLDTNSELSISMKDDASLFENAIFFFF